MLKYNLEFILNTYNTSADIIKNSLSEFGENLEITVCQDSNAKSKDYKINLNTEEPTVIFDVCSQFGKIKTIKVSEDIT